MDYNIEENRKNKILKENGIYQTTTITTINDNDDFNGLRQRLIDRNACIQITLYRAVCASVHNHVEILSTAEAEADLATILQPDAANNRKMNLLIGKSTDALSECHIMSRN